MCNKNIDHYFKAITTFSLCCLIAANAVATDTAPTRHGKHDVTRNILRGGGSEKYVKDTLCEGYQYVFGGKKYKETGVYQDTVIENGKEEIYTLDLVVLPPSDTTFISDTNKEGESYQKNGFNITDTEVGTHYYFLDLENKAGCDSVVCLALTTKKAKDPNNGTILFKEDFGGNSVNDPIAKTEGIPQCSYNYNVNPKGGGNYAIRKVGWDHNQWYYPIYDHTYPDDGERGYLMQVDGAGDNGVFYQTQIDGLCANMELYLSIWGMSSTKTSGWNDAELELIVEDLHGNILASKEIVLENQKGYWEQFGLYYVTPQDETSIIYKIKNSSSSSSGNDFMIDDIEVKISTPAVNVPDIKDTLCVGENYSLSATFENDGTYQEPLVYAWYHSDKATYDISDWEFVSYGKELNFSNLKETDAGYYKVWIGSNGTTDINTTCNAASDIIELNVKECGSICGKDYITLSDTITLGDSYHKNGFSITNAPLGKTPYKLELTNAQGCDSIVTLYLTVLDSAPCTATDTIIYENICEGESYSFDGKTLTEGGTFTQKITKKCSNGNTIDSTVTLNLTVSQSYNETVTGTIYVGETYKSYGFNVQGNTAGQFQYKQELLSSTGCDSIVNLTLTVKEPTQPTVPEPSPTGTYNVVYDGNGATSGQMDKHVYSIGADETTQLDANKYKKIYNVKFDTQGGSEVDGIQSPCEFVGWLQDEFLTSTTNVWKDTWTNVFPQYTKITNEEGVNVVNVSTQPSVWERLYSHPVYMPKGDHIVKFSFCSPTGYFDCTSNPNLDEPASRLKLAVCSTPQTSNSTDKNYLTNGTDYSYVIFKQYDPTTTMQEKSLILYSTGEAAYFAFNCGNLQDLLDIELRVSPLTLYINGESYAIYNDMANTTELVREETGTVTLKAQWEDKPIVTPFAPTKEGYTFKEWNTKVDGTGDSYAAYVNVEISSDTTLYAIWVKDDEIGGDPQTPGNELQIPTAFTPHFNDGMNDIFLKGYEVYIYDRYGDLITHSNNGWDGTYKGETATPGVYVYVLKLQEGKSEKTIKGTIEIVKAK